MLKTLRVKELMAELAKLDPEEDIFIMDNEYGVTEIDRVAKERHTIETENGRFLPKMVWVIE